MNLKTKTIIIIILVLLVTLISFLIWRLFNRKEAVEPIITETPAQLEAGEERAQNEQRLEKGYAVLEKISDTPVFDFWTIPDTNEVFYITTEGKVFRAKKDVDEAVSEDTFQAIGGIESSDNGTKLLMFFGDPQAPNWGVFDIYDRAWSPLPENIETATWGSDTETIYALTKNNGNKNLIELKIGHGAATSKPLIQNLNIEDVTLAFFPPETLLLKEKSSSQNEAGLYSVNLKNKKISLVKTPSRGFLFALDKKNKVGYSFETNQRFKIYNLKKGLDLENIIPVFFNTLPQKCTSFKNLIFCLSPSNPEFEEGVLPDDYFKENLLTTDTLHLINQETSLGEALVMTGTAALKAADGKKITYTDGKIHIHEHRDKFVYELVLPKAIKEKIESQLITETSALLSSTTTSQ